MSNISRQNSQVKGKGKEVVEERPPKKVANEYQLKSIEWVDILGQTQRLKIITQNENGPCPLLALCNVLLLRGLIEIKPYDRSFVTYDYLVELLGDYLLRTIPNGEIGEAEIQKGILEDLKFNQLSKTSQEKQPVNENEESLNKNNQLSNFDNEGKVTGMETEIDDKGIKEEVVLDDKENDKENDKEKEKKEIEMGDKEKEEIEMGYKKEEEVETGDKEKEVEMSDKEKEKEMEMSDKEKEKETETDDKEKEVEMGGKGKEKEVEIEDKVEIGGKEKEIEMGDKEKEKEMMPEKSNKIDQNSEDSNPFNNSAFTRISLQDYHHTLHTALSIIPSLQSGLDVNVRFNSIHGFEPTAELSVFDIFNVELVHGWVVDPQDEETWEVVVGKCGSYNKAVECVVRGDSLSKGVVLESIEKSKVSNIKPEKNSDAMENSKVRDALITSQFLESTATQLTYHGLLTLSEALPPGNLCVFFRNNHFSTLFKHPKTSVLYILVTDAGFVHERSAVWESLIDVDQGASEFVNGKFIKGETTGGDYVEVSEHHEIHEISGGGDQDYALALSLQQQEDDREAEYLRKRNQMNSQQQQSRRRDQEEIQKQQKNNNLSPNQVQSDDISQSSVGSSFTTASSSEKERRKDKKKECIIT
ncbi:hypothetical protein Glove_744g8 [Diversispora epigaea]|uniref:MINDY deubiquitinase domain-containing protein n=1 Tax=Diversispora epigaea TaxID=1348612 RepID=A0A397G5V4_9GLOM|nr:hypothetical protein Glove_744g8 [Diversispora epigaea]